jgi:hypothetical protein
MTNMLKKEIRWLPRLGSLQFEKKLTTRMYYITIQHNEEIIQIVFFYRKSLNKLPYIYLFFKKNILTGPSIQFFYTRQTLSIKIIACFLRGRKLFFDNIIEENFQKFTLRM